MNILVDNFREYIIKMVIKEDKAKKKPCRHIDE